RAGGGGVSPAGGRAVSDVAVDDHQGRTVGGSLEGGDGTLEQVEIVGVADAHHVPAVRQEPAGDVVAEGQLRVALDRDVVVVVDPAQVGDAQVAGRRAGPVRDP